MRLASDRLEALGAAILERAGCGAEEARVVARDLVHANEVGHDSHGILRVPHYVRQLREGSLKAERNIRVVSDSGATVVLDGRLGFGQVIGRQAMARGVGKARAYGIALVCLHDVGHVGRLGDWAEYAAERGMVSFHFVNTIAGIRVAPFGGRERRMSTNPLCVGIPVPGRPPIVADMTTSAVAEGKIFVALNQGKDIPEGWVVDKDGNAATDPKALYDGGAMLPFGAHKGYALSVVVDLLAGALAGGRSSDPDETVMRNNMLSILIAPSVYGDDGAIGAEVRRFADWVTSSAPAEPGGEVLLPGEIEHRTCERRRADGIEIDDQTWRQLVECAQSFGLDEGQCRELAGI